MSRKIPLLIAAFAAAAFIISAGAFSRPELDTDLPEVADAESAWVDSIYNSLSHRRRVAQLFIPHIIIKNDAAGREQIARLVAQDGVGGLLLGKSDIAQYAALNNYAFSLAQVPLMITADAEWGLSMRLSDAPRFPHNIAIGATSDTAALAAYGREMARECRELGITVSFAPVADVNSNAQNPIIGFRSFGEDPERVAVLSGAYSRGLQEGGVIAVGKHFPGHGDTSTDSHKTLPVVNRTLAELNRVELVPFRALIDNGIDGIMVGHIKMPSLDATGVPASLSQPIVTKLLKEKMGFDGLIFTDALEMQGAQVKGSNNCVLALEAGADVLLGSTKPSTDIDAVLRAVESGRLPAERVEQSVKKALAYKYRLGLTKRPVINQKTASATINSPEAENVNSMLAKAAIIIVRNHGNLLPLNRSSKVIVCSPDGKATEFRDIAKKCCDDVEFMATLNRQSVNEADAVILPVTSTGTTAVTQVAAAAEIAGSKLVAVMLMNPYKMEAFAPALRNCGAIVAAGDNTPHLREAAANAIFGTADANGRMVVSVKGIAKAGEGIDIEAQRLGRTGVVETTPAVAELRSTVDALIAKGLDERAFTGCQVMIVKDGEVIVDRSEGTVDGRGSAPVTSETLFDLASVSKVAGTLIGLMAAYDRGMFKLNDTLDRFFPELVETDLGRVSMRSLMFHQSGLPAAIPVKKIVTAPDGEIRRDIYSSFESDEFDLPVAGGIFASEAAVDTIMAAITSITPKPAKSYCYSDLNFVLLMEALQRITGRGADEWTDETVYAPLGIKRLAYRPLDLFDKEEIAATEHDATLRHQKVHGYVHDETAAFMGGVAGNAGLFGNSDAIAVLCQMLINGGRYDGRQILSEKTVRMFLTERAAGGRRGLGFDTAGDGRFLGHTGFTGTCFWFDKAADLTVVVLTNRVNPSRDNKAWSRLNFRNSILNAACKAFPMA